MTTERRRAAPILVGSLATGLAALLSVGLAALLLREESAAGPTALEAGPEVAAIGPTAPVTVVTVRDPAALDWRVLDDVAATPLRRGAALGRLLAARDLATRERAVTRALHALDVGEGAVLEAQALRGLATLASGPDAAQAGAVSLRALHALERTADPELALAAGEALDALPPPSLADLQVTLGRAALPAARVVLVRALVAAGAAEARPALEGLLLSDPAPEVRAEVLSHALVWAGRDAPDVLVRALNEPSLRAAAAAVVPRVSAGGELDRALAERFAAETDPATARALARALVARPEGPTLLLRAALGAGPPAVAAAGALGLASDGGEAALGQVVDAGQEPEARAAAVATLGQRRRLPAARLLALVADPAEPVRAAALRAQALSGAPREGS